MLVPIGTRVVLRVPVTGTRAVYSSGAVAVIVDVPRDATHAYRVRLPDGYECTAVRSEFAILADVKSPMPPAMLDDRELRSFIVYSCVVGSRAYGLDHADSDVDRRGVYLPPADRHWSLFGVPEQLEDREREECHWEMQKFLVLAAKANPNVLECLWTPRIEHIEPIGEELLAIRDAFLSKLVYQTFNGYVISQFRKMAVKLRRSEEPSRKHAMHLIRLLRTGIGTLLEHRVPVAVGDAREELLSIRDGTMPWQDVEALRHRLHDEFDRAFAATTLPDRPDYSVIDRFLLRARRSVL
ncbi:MAG: nucleotidyltransferase domain-containing protein [Planctomycetota bacterium]